jgi:hypothetical protein
LCIHNIKEKPIHVSLRMFANITLQTVHCFQLIETDKILGALQNYLGAKS